jgi:hypothetical protein
MTSASHFGRRAFLGLAATAGVAIAGVSLDAAPGAAAVATAEGQLWRLDKFKPLRGQRFAVAGGGSLTLVDVVDHSRPGGDTAETFLLLFEPHGIRGGSSLLTLSHRAVGSFTLGLTSVGRRSRLQAVIDQRRPRTAHKEP